MKQRAMFLMLSVLLASLSCVTPAAALTIDPNSDAVTRTLSDYVKDYVDTPADALNWKQLGQTKEIRVDGKTKDGYDFEYYKPGFTPDTKALDGKTVKIKGFMFPLDPSEKQSLFLIGPFPVSCPFHYHVGPAMVIEVHTGKETPVKFSYDPVLIEGRFELVEKDMENSTFYRLQDAHLVKE